MQGISAAPKGLPVRNTFINTIWEKHAINEPVPRENALDMANTGYKSVPLPVYRDARLPRLKGARARSVAAITQDWGVTSDHWNAPHMDTGAVAATRSTLTPLRGSGLDYSGNPVTIPLAGTMRWRERSYHRSIREFVPDSRFGPEWSHINTDGTLREFNPPKRSAR
jgi:hypothetical protein